MYYLYLNVLTCDLLRSIFADTVTCDFMGDLSPSNVLCIFSGVHGQCVTRICIRRYKYPNNHPYAAGILWQWEDHTNTKPNTWKAYDMETAWILEDAYYGCVPSVRLLNKCRLNRMPYDIDLNKMEQININTGFVRSVRRNVPGQTPTDYSGGKLSKTKAYSAAAVVLPSSRTSTGHKSGMSTGHNSPMNIRSSTKNSTSSNSPGYNVHFK